MSYTQGDAKYGKLYYDSRNEEHSDGDGVVYLPHSCEDWVIGNKEEVETMIKDLQKLLKKHV